MPAWLEGTTRRLVLALLLTGAAVFVLRDGVRAEAYWAQGYPAVMVTDTASLRSHAHHSADDTADRLDCERVAMVVDGVFAALIELGRR